MNTFTAKLRSDKRKNPEYRNYRFMTLIECKHAHHIQFLDRNGDVAEAKVTTVKTWKTRPEIEVHCKFGLYEYFNVMVYPDKYDTFVKEVFGQD